MSFQKKLLLPNGNSIKVINIELIKYIEADGNYSRINMIDNKSSIVVSQSLKQVESLLLHDRFSRCSKSIIINLDMVDSIKKGKSRIIVFKDLSMVELSLRGKIRLLQQLKDYFES
tara:strand:- start:9 stop:356 length:348 start_codon:yes stop_codon:yes gene_type:complete